MRSSKRALAIALVVAGLISGTGCGNNSHSAPTPPAISEKLASAIEEICARGRLRALRFQPPRESQSRHAALAHAIETTLLPSLQEVIDEIRALRTPPGEGTPIERLLIAMQNAVDQAEALEPHAVKAVENLLEGRGKLARKAQLVSCIYG